MGKKKREDNNEEAKANLTSFLDLIFNILSFFVMTFSPPIAEKNFDVQLPPPKIEKDTSSAATSEAFIPEEEEEILKDMKIHLTAGPEGTLATIRVEGSPVPSLARLPGHLQLLAGAVGGTGGEPMEAAMIIASPTLKYEHVIATVDACYRAKISRIGFSQASK